MVVRARPAYRPDPRPQWILGYVPIVVVLCATVTLTAISFRMLRMRRFVRRSLRKRDQLQLSLLLVSVIYCAYMVTMISIFGINYLVRCCSGGLCACGMRRLLALTPSSPHPRCGPARSM